MADIWELFDQFTCKICFKQYTPLVLPVIICQNAHLICKQCLKDMKNNNKLPNLLCPFCRTVIKPNHTMQFQKLLQLKGATVRILQGGKKEEQILKMIKQEIGFSNNLSLNVQKLYNELTLIDSKWKFVSTIHRNCIVQNAIVWKKISEIQNQVRIMREQLLNLSQTNRILAKEAEQVIALKKNNALLTKHAKKLKEIIAFLSLKNDENKVQVYDLCYLHRSSSLPKPITFQNMHSLEQFEKRKYLEERLFVNTYENKSQINENTNIYENQEKRYQVTRNKIKSQYHSKMASNKLEAL